MSTVGVILAGGQSTRMKQDKALLEIQGETLLRRQFAFLERVLGPGNVLVSGSRPEFPHVRDLNQGGGPVEGLRSVCRFIFARNPRSSILVTPVDMPLMTEMGLRRILNHKTVKHLTKFRSEQLPFVVHHLVQVLAAIDSMQVQTSDATSKSAKSISLGRLFTLLEVDELSVEPGDSFFTNTNTPEDWHAAISQTNDPSSNRK